MDDSLRLLQYLYGEDVDDPSFARRLSQDEALRREYERLKSTKEELDLRPSPQPDTEVVDRVVDAAADAAPRAAPADDRPPRFPSRSQRRRLQGAAALFAVLLLVGLGWWQVDVSAPGDTAPPSALEGTSAASAEATTDEEAVPDWDDSEELVRLHRRIQHLQARSTSEWGASIQSVDQSQP